MGKHSRPEKKPKPEATTPDLSTVLGKMQHQIEGLLEGRKKDHAEIALLRGDVKDCETALEAVQTIADSALAQARELQSKLFPLETPHAQAVRGLMENAGRARTADDE